MFCALWYHTRDRGYDLLRALCSVSCHIAYERAGVTICHGHWGLHLVIPHTRQGVLFVTGIGFCVLWKYHTRDKGLRFVTGIGFFILRYHTRDRGFDLIRTLGPASCDLAYESAGVQFVRGIGLCFLWFLLQDREYDLLQTLGSSSCVVTFETGVRFVTGIGVCNITHETGGMICYGSCDIIHETEGTTCYGHWVLHLVISPTNQRGYSLLGAGLGILLIAHETMGTICYGHWVLHLVISHTRPGLRFVNGIGFCVFWNHTRDRRFDLLRVLGLAFCLAYERAGVTICYEHWVLHFAKSHTRQRVRFVTGIGFCIAWYLTQDKGYDLLRALGSASWDITHETGGTICYDIGFCILGYHTRNTGYDLLLALGSGSCEITHETGDTICYVRWVLHFVISTRIKRWLQVVTGLGFCIWRSHTGAGVRFVTGIVFCILWSRLRYSGGDDLLRALCSARCGITHETGVRFVTGIGFCILRYHTRHKGYELWRALGSASCDLIHETGGTICHGHTRHGVRFATGIGSCIMRYHRRDRGYDL